MVLRAQNMSLIILVIILLDILLSNAANVPNNTVSPKITLLYLGSKWKNILTPTNSSLYSAQHGDDLQLECTANYPIQWNFTGLLNPPEIAQFQPPRRNLISNVYKIELLLFFQDAKSFPDLGSSVRVTCEHVGNVGCSDRIYIFVRGNSNQSLVLPKSTTVFDSTLIPCPTKNPTQIVTLYRRNTDGTEQLVNSSNITYHFTEGFHSNQMFSGVYICRQGISSISVNAVVTKVLNDFQLSPNSNDIVRAFTEDTMQFECKSISLKSLHFITDYMDHDKVTFSFVNVSDHHIIAKATSRILTGVASTTGTLACVTADGGRVVKRWSFEFVETPELYLDNYRREVHCLSSVSPKMIQTVRCINKMHCNFMISQHCLENETDCNFKKQKQFYNKQDSFCYLPKYGNSRDCVSVPYSHLNGLIQCRVAGLVKQWEDFVTLDFLKNTNWMETSSNELIRMHETKPILYTNETNQFVCVAVAYLFADSISFEIEYKNESRHLLEGNNSTVKISRPGDKDARKIDEFNIIGILDIQPSIDARAIHCIASWWNSTNTGIRTSRRFETRHLVPPHLNTNGLQNSSDHVKMFYTDRENNRLKCFAKGEPRPTFEWYFNNEKALKLLPKLSTSTSVGANGYGESYLHFPFIKAEQAGKYSGEFKCVAKNRVGSVEQRYQLQVTTPEILMSTETNSNNNNSNVLLHVTIGFTLLILAGVLITLVIFVERYKRAKQYVQSLTDMEIDEFVHGNPNSVSSSCSRNSSAESAQLLPYDREKYEIPLEDLELDFSDNDTVLGSGNFAYVVRGKIRSLGRLVAVKISKPTADVPTFKTFLSEVKIMTFVGQHENIVSLIGACTESIRNCLIYIVTDICELGSLEKFLRKSKSCFVNLVNANQEIDLVQLLATQLSNQLNTLHLISISAQIANGMEYLQSKGVLHGDLAARNVLLTSEKVAKISDFGLSKKLYENRHYVRKSYNNLPWRWMAIECHTTLTFSAYSDIWAFGVTLFEIFTLGDVPFPNEVWNKDFIARLASGMRMGRPEYSTQEIYQKIAACWEKVPEQRPSFGTLHNFFQNTLRSAINYLRQKSDYLSLQDVQFFGLSDL